MVHVKDAVQAILCLLESDPKLIGGDIFNIEYRNFTMRELAAAVAGGIERNTEHCFLEQSD
jgi:nucleoside-diphosphate-sugar epimerase